METKNTKAARNPLANLDANDLKMVSEMVAANTKATKASEALTRAIGKAYNAGLHTKAGYSNFGKWFVEAMEAKGTTVSKSRAYNAVKCAEVRAAAPEAETLPDTVVVRIAETAPMGDSDKVAEFVAEVVKAGGTVESVKSVSGGDTDARDPLDAAAEDFAKRIVRLTKGDAKAADAAIEYARSEVKRLMIEATKAAMK